jgi:DNA invertase Pin-like site-specific DNA recombinase
MNIGYGRVSTNDQNLGLQEDALKKMNCVKIYTDKISGRTDEREGLNQALSFAREGDNIVVWRLDRLGRSLKHLIEVMNELEKRKIGLISVTEAIDTTTPGGKLVFHIFGALAQFETDLIRQRTLSGLQAARDRGRVGGRPNKLDRDQMKLLQELRLKNNLSMEDISKMLGTSKATLYRTLNKSSEQIYSGKSLTL